MRFLMRIHDYKEPEDNHLQRFLGKRRWEFVALGHGQLLGVLTSAETTQEIQSGLAECLDWPAQCLVVPIDQDRPPLSREGIPAWLRAVGQPGLWSEGLRSRQITPAATRRASAYPSFPLSEAH